MSVLSQRQVSVTSSHGVRSTLRRTSLPPHTTIMTITIMLALVRTLPARNMTLSVQSWVVCGQCLPRLSMMSCSTRITPRGHGLLRMVAMAIVSPVLLRAILTAVSSSLLRDGWTVRLLKVIIALATSGCLRSITVMRLTTHPLGVAVKALIQILVGKASPSVVSSVMV